MAQTAFFKAISKYYSVTVDSTSDVTHVDQLTLIIMYMQDDSTIVERFLKFIDSNGQHDAESVTNHVLRTRTEYDINLDNCRGQSFDNARIYQKIILECKPDSKH